MSLIETTRLDSASQTNLLTARFMLPDQSEHVCQVRDLTLEGATFLADVVPEAGQIVIAYIEELGRIEAVTGEATHHGFTVLYALKGARLERLQQRIEWLQQRSSGDRSDQRRHTRFEPVDRALHLTLPDGRVYPCEVIDISTSGAGVKTDIMPSIGTQLMLGKMRGRVVRYLDEGIAIEFMKQLDSSQLPAVTGRAAH
ncbi:PilZ domain-containing protein [Aestuariivirga litoralis]|uniref:PilZ domain-containing protein n=1 Tax=Aestuariivirga litoralis TaxID=2650924 RepID=UPI0018C47CB2|nr:PilZ domain-containing protein [Aestuariivirga litoralis]MBG1231861.1 PilZ domain-containing protein [Aestuariivirga litoralis]